MNLLLLSNSTSDAGYLSHALPGIAAWAGGPRDALFVPYAGIMRSWDDYEALVAGALSPLGLRLHSLHRQPDARAAVEAARLIIVGGGNTFVLLQQLRRQGLLDTIATRVRSGRAGYLGWSAGSNLACPTICTTNDMPIVDPGGLDALGLVPFQINPHYTEAHPSGHRGETRQQRLREFCALKPQMPVLGLPEGTGLQLQGDVRTLLGQEPARWLLGAQAVQLIQPGPWTDS